MLQNEHTAVEGILGEIERGKGSKTPQSFNFAYLVV